MKTLKFTVESKLNHIKLLCRAFRAACATVVKDEDLLYNLELCLDEAVTNVIEHAYDKQPGHYIDIVVALDENEVDLQVIDNGHNAPSSLLKNSLNYNPDDINTLPEYGIGLFLIHQIMDVVSYTSNGEKNVTTLKKYLRPQGDSLESVNKPNKTLYP